MSSSSTRSSKRTNDTQSDPPRKKTRASVAGPAQDVADADITDTAGDVAESDVVPAANPDAAQPTVAGQDVGVAVGEPSTDTANTAENVAAGEAEEAGDGIPVGDPDEPIEVFNPEGRVLLVLMEAGEVDSREGVSITVDSRHYFGADLVTRFNKLNDYCNRRSATFTLHTMPMSGMYWGTSADGFMADAFLFFGGKRVVLWMVADLSVVKFFNDDGSALNTPFVGVVPLLPEDFEAGTHLINRLSMPKKDEYLSQALWASKYCSPRGTPDDKVKRFRDVFDAQEAFQAKAKMDRLPCDVLRAGDVVLLECSIRRWPTSETEDSIPTGSAGPSVRKTMYPRGNGSGTAANYKDRKWTKWSVGFRAEAVSLLYKGSDFHVGNVPSEDVCF